MSLVTLNPRDIPVSKTIQKVLEDSGKVVASNNSSDGEHEEADGSPNDSGNFDSPHADVLHTETKGVDVGDGDGNGGKDENELDEFAESIGGGAVTLERLIHESTNSSSIESRLESITSRDASRQCGTQCHDEDLARNEREIGPAEEAHSAGIFSHIDRVIGREWTPGNSITETRCHE